MFRHGGPTAIDCILLASLAACSKAEQGLVSGEYSIDGRAQKGPFIQGTTVRISELDSNLVPTGRSFETTIGSDTGEFSLPAVLLESQFVRLSANGFYFNVVTGERSDRWTRVEGSGRRDPSHEY